MSDGTEGAATTGASDAGARPYEELDRAGERLGHVLGGFIVGAKRLMAAPRASAPDTGAGTADGQSALVRAERMVDSAGSRLGVYAQIARWQLQRGLARAREEAEDIRAEAEAMRRRGSPSGSSTSSAPGDTQASDVAASSGAGVERAD